MRVFVYGTLKRGGRLHEHIEEQQFLGAARTTTRCRLFRLGWYPGLVEDSGGVSVAGEVWDVDNATLAVLDEIEGVDEGLYERRPIHLQPPFDREDVVTYYYLGDVAECSDCGAAWDVAATPSDSD